MDIQTFLPIYTECTNEKSTLVIVYVDKAGKLTGREVEPYKLEANVPPLKSKFWGLDIRYNGIRQFDVQRIKQAIKTNRTFVPRWDTELLGNYPKLSDAGFKGSSAEVDVKEPEGV